MSLFFLKHRIISLGSDPRSELLGERLNISVALEILCQIAFQKSHYTKEGQGEGFIPPCLSNSVVLSFNH